MDWTLVLSFVSSAVAVCALVLSLFTYLRAEREKVVMAERDFLQTSMYMTERMKMAVLRFVAEPSPKTLSSDIIPVVEEFVKLKPISLQWKDRDYYDEFNRLLAAIGKVGSAFEGGPDQVVNAFEELLARANSYASLARTKLLER